MGYSISEVESVQTEWAFAASTALSVGGNPEDYVSNRCREILQLLRVVQEIDGVEPSPERGARRVSPPPKATSNPTRSPTPPRREPMHIPAAQAPNSRDGGQIP